MQIKTSCHLQVEQLNSMPFILPKSLAKNLREPTQEEWAKGSKDLLEKKVQMFKSNSTLPDLLFLGKLIVVENSPFQSNVVDFGQHLQKILGKRGTQMCNSLLPG